MRHCGGTYCTDELSTFLDEPCSFGVYAYHEAGYVVEKDDGITTRQWTVSISYAVSELGRYLPLITEPNELCRFI